MAEDFVSTTTERTEKLDELNLFLTTMHGNSILSSFIEKTSKKMV